LHFTSASRHEHLGPTGPLLGLSGLLKPNFTQARVHFAPESALVIVTDGITEARRYDRRELSFFGSTGVARAFAAAQRAKRDPAEAIAGAAHAHAGRALCDDATVLVVQPRRPFPYHQPHF
jgi:serine phosphatase RsbU (regulator of sigma subunit)